MLVVGLWTSWDSIGLVEVRERVVFLLSTFDVAYDHHVNPPKFHLCLSTNGKLALTISQRIIYRVTIEFLIKF